MSIVISLAFTLSNSTMSWRFILFSLLTAGDGDLGDDFAFLLDYGELFTLLFDSSSAMSFYNESIFSLLVAS